MNWVELVIGLGILLLMFWLIHAVQHDIFGVWPECECEDKDRNHELG